MNQDAYYQEIEWKRHYHLIEYQRCVLARYSMMRHVNIKEEEKRLRQALFGSVLFFGLAFYVLCC